MGNKVVSGLVAVVSIVGVVILLLRDANPNTLVLATIMIANALGIGYGNNRTDQVATTAQTIAEQTNGTLTALKETVETHMPAIASELQNVKEAVQESGQQ